MFTNALCDSDPSQEGPVCPVCGGWLRDNLFAKCWEPVLFCPDCEEEELRQPIEMPEGPTMREPIKIHYDPPPIPVRNFDYTATFGYWDEGDPIGYGATAEEAKADLLDKVDDEADA